MNKLRSTFLLPGPWKSRGRHVPKVPAVGTANPLGLMKTPEALCVEIAARLVVVPANGFATQFAYEAWLPPVWLLSGDEMFIGNPVWSVRMPFNCQFPSKRAAMESLAMIDPSLPKGSFHWYRDLIARNRETEWRESA